jgi:hypothetical protein
VQFRADPNYTSTPDGSFVAAQVSLSHFCGRLKYFKSGGIWSFLVGINKPPALSM